MGFNRVADSGFDALNPRTSSREIPSGAVAKRSVKLMTLISAIVFLISAGMLGAHCLLLAPLVLGWLFFYSWTKRFTALSHFVLGISLAMAPGGVWYAVTGVFSWIPVSLMLAVLLWVAGFDLIYSCQDVEFDRTNNLFSLPAKLGIAPALQISRILHVLAICSLIIFGYVFGCGWPYYIATAVFAILVASQHMLVNPNDFSKVNAAFFTRNGLASVVYFLGTLGEYYAAA
jgi:4-hydroxybenzoate polyprenyltransferase